MSRKKDSDSLKPKKTLSTEDLRKMIDDSGLSIYSIEKGIGMPDSTLLKCYNAKPDARGYTRTLPAKWELKLLQYIKEKKVAVEESKEEVKEILKESGIDVPIVIPESVIDDMEGKTNWMNKLKEVQDELED